MIVDKPGAPQTALEVFGIGVPADSPDASADGDELHAGRQLCQPHQHESARGARVYVRREFGFTEYLDGGMFVAGGLVRTDVTAPAAKELMKEIREFPASLRPAEELAAAKEASIQSLPGQFETTSSIVRAMDGIFLYGRPLGYYAKLPAKYEAVTEADIARVAQQYLHPDQLVIVTAGDRAKIEPGLKDAGLGPSKCATSAESWWPETVRSVVRPANNSSGEAMAFGSGGGSLSFPALAATHAVRPSLRGLFLPATWCIVTMMASAGFAACAAVRVRRARVEIDGIARIRAWPPGRRGAAPVHLR